MANPPAKRPPPLSVGAALLTGALALAAAHALASVLGVAGEAPGASDGALLDTGERGRPDAMPDARRPGPAGEP